MMELRYLKEFSYPWIVLVATTWAKVIEASGFENILYSEKLK